MKNTLYKGTLKNIILKLLKDNGSMYGYQMTQIAKERTKGELTMTEGALYPLLHKLEDEGLIISDTRTVNGRSRKYYLLSKHGKREQIDFETQMKSYIINLKNIFEL